MEPANSLSQLGSFEPHGQCFLWNSDLVLLHAISDSLTALAYYSISIALLYFVRKRQDLPYTWMFVLFGAFILACGTTHLMAVWTIWKPDYWLEGTIKGINAAVSIAAAGLLWPIMPQLLRLPSPVQLAAANQELQQEIAVRKLAETELSGIQLELERHVQERTAELSQANKALHADIAARMRAEESLHSAMETLSAMINCSPVGITILRSDGTVRLWNPAAERIYGWRKEEVLDRPLPTIPEGMREEHRAFRESILRGDTFTGKEVIRQKKDGSTVSISLSTTALRDNEGRVRGILGIMEDITNRKRMQEQAARMERLVAMGQLLGGIAHEIKNPLFVVTGRIQLLKEMLANQEYDAMGRDLQSIEEAGMRMATITQRFLGLARPSKPQWQSCSVHDVLTQTLNFLANELMKSRIQVVRAFAPDMPQTWSEFHQLHDVFLNLILNAIQAMTAARGQGTLTITTSRTTDSIVIRIQDDGPGIAPQHRAKLFEPFFTTKPAGEGTGLGLWTVRSMMAGLNGTVECESVEGQGATFIVSIPIVSYPPKE